MEQRVQDPDANKDWTVDWAPFLGTGETIGSSSVTATPAGLGVSDDPQATSVVVWITGGTNGTAYRVKNHIVTNQGRAEDYVFEVIIRNKETQ